jgi:HlyD family secretion protein
VAPGARRRRTHLQRTTRGWSRAIIWSLIGLTGFGVAYGSVARIETSISAEGRLRPVGGSFELVPPFTAPIRKVLVREGQLVVAGQPLVELDGENAARQWQELAGLRRLWSQEANQAALQLGLPALPLEGSEQRLALQDQLRDTALRRKAANERRLRSLASIGEQSSALETLRQKRTINANIQRRMEGLVRQGAISRLELDRQEERNVELDGLIHRTEQQLEAARRDLGESEANLDQVGSGNRRLLYGQYSEARRQLLETSTRLEQLQSRLRLGVLRAPVEGMVFDLRAKPGELAAGHSLLRIVPQQSLEVELSVSNRDIGFLRPGLPVDVRITSFPFTDYGSLRGTILRVGADALPPDARSNQEVFPAIVRLESSQLERRGKRYALRPGMAVSGLIQLGNRPVLALMNDRIGAFIESLRAIR